MLLLYPSSPIPCGPCMYINDWRYFLTRLLHHLNVSLWKWLQLQNLLLLREICYICSLFIWHKQDWFVRPLHIIGCCCFVSGVICGRYCYIWYQCSWNILLSFVHCNRLIIHIEHIRLPVSNHNTLCAWIRINLIIGHTWRGLTYSVSVEGSC